MTFVRCNREDVLKYYSYKYGRNQKLVNDFIDSDYDCVELKDYPHKTAYSCAGAITKSIKRMNIKSICVICKNGKVYLVKR